MTQQYGTVKVDFITFTSGTTGNETDITIPVSGLADIAESGINISGDISARNITATGDLSVSGETLTSGLIVQNDATISGDLGVSGEVTASSVTVTGTLNASGDVNVSGLLTTSGLSVTGTADVNALNVTGLAAVGTLTTTGSATVNGLATLNSGLTVGGATSTFDDTVTIASGLTVTNGGIVVSNSGGLNVDGDVIFQDNLNVSGTADFDDISASGTTTLNELTVTGAMTFATGLFASGTESAPSISFAGDSDTGFYNAAANEVRITTNGNDRLTVDDTGNFGIGTTDPFTFLHVRNNVQGNVGSAPASSGTTDPTTISRIASRGVVGLDVGLLDNGTSYIQNRNEGDFSTNYNFVINPNGGNVGIGTTSAASRLQVENNSGTGIIYLLDLYAPNESQNPIMRFISRNAANTATTSVDFYKVYQGGFTIGNNDTAASNYTSFNVGASERLRITSDGNVGIGTTSPNQKLQLQTSSSNCYLRTNDGTVDGYFGVSSASSTLQVYTASSSPIQFVVNNSEAARIDSSGRVGIGTSSPSQKLTVSGGNILLDSNDQLRFGTSNAAFIEGSGNDGSGGTRYMRFAVNSEAMRIDSSGRLLVGTTSSITGSAGQTSIQVAGTNTTQGGLSLFRSFPIGTPEGTAYMQLGRNGGSTVGALDIVASDSRIGLISFDGADGTAYRSGAYIYAEVDGTPGANDMPGRLIFSTTADGASTPTERMRIKANGSILFADEDEAGITSGSVNGKSIEAGSIMRSSRATTASATHIGFYNSNGLVGQISTSASATAYSTSSDYRLKENVVPLTGAANRLNQLQVHRFNFIADPNNTVDGFLAHEAQDVIPECVTGTKDEVDDEGNPVYQGIDQSKIVPLLTAALQEALAKIESLESRLAALENS